MSLSHSLAPLLMSLWPVILCRHGQGVSVEVGPGWWTEEFVRGEKIALFTKGFITMYHRLNGFKLQKFIASLSGGY